MDELLYSELLARLKGSLSGLPDKPEETAESTLHALWSAASGNPQSAAMASKASCTRLDGPGRSRLRQLVDQRLAGTPLAHLTGRQHFMGLELLAGPGALVPRKETEILGNAALDLLRVIQRIRGNAVVVDVCCGSGNVAVSLASYEAAAKVYAADISHDAVSLARKNVEWLHLTDRVMVTQGDLLDPFDSAEFYGQVDLLTCNPPYISSAKVNSMHEEIRMHEPREAFDGGVFGIRIVQRLVKDAVRFLRPGGWLVFELGAGQGVSVIERMARDGRYREILGVRDESGQIRAISAML